MGFNAASFIHGPRPLYDRSGGGRPGPTDSEQAMDEFLKQKDEGPVLGMGPDNTGEALGHAADTSANSSAGYVQPQNASWFDNTSSDWASSPDAAPAAAPSPNFDQAGYGNDADTVPSHDAGWFERNARGSLTQVARMLQVPDAGAPNQEVPTTANTAGDVPKFSADFHYGKDAQAQKDARGPSSYFDKLKDVQQQLEDQATKMTSDVSFGSSLMHHLLPSTDTGGAKLRALMVQERLLRQEANQKYFDDHPELAQPKRSFHNAPPGTTVLDEQGKPIFTADDRPAKDSAPKFSMHADPETGDVSGYDPTTNTLTPTMTPRFDTTGPSMDGSAGYTGQQQAKVNPKPKAEKEPRQIPHIQYTDADNQQWTAPMKPDGTPDTTKATRLGKKQSEPEKAAESDRKKARDEYQAWASKNPRATPAQIAQQKKALDPDGKLLGAPPVKGKTSSGKDFEYVP